MRDTPQLIEGVVAAISRLVERAESVEDEWIYIHDLETVWVARLRAVAAARSGAAADGDPAAKLSPAAAGALEIALDRLVAEADLVADPHRAIDWLSTVPQAALVALGEPAW
jgi:hypothetical protein